jgi:hypothetical protein
MWAEGRSGEPMPSCVVHGLEVNTLPCGFQFVQRYVGEKNIPHDIKMTRKSSFEVMRRMGTPVVIKHMYNDEDVQAGIAEPSPNFNSVYKQTRPRDPLSYGNGFVSVEKSNFEWINTANSQIVTTKPSPTAPKAPMYRGFGPGYLTYIIEPDVTEDWYKHSEEGVFTRVQSARVQAPWWPEVHDGDLIVEVTLDDGGNLVSTGARFQAKMATPNSIRGLDQRGRREFNSHPNRHVVNQQFEMSRIPDNHPLMEVEMDR